MHGLKTLDHVKSQQFLSCKVQADQPECQYPTLYGSNQNEKYLSDWSNYNYNAILEDNLSCDFLYKMSTIEYPYVNNDWLWV